MQEITELKITRKQLAAEHIYYNGCKSQPLHQKEADEVIALAADVLIQILMNMKQE